MNGITLAQSALTTAHTDLLQEWEQFSDVSEKSRRTYRVALKNFFNFLKTAGVKNPTRETVIQWRESLKETSSVLTVQTYITAVKLFFKWTAAAGLFPNVADHVKGVKVPSQHRKDYLTTNQARAVLKTVSAGTSEKELRNAAIVALMMTSGLRTIEVARADVADIRQKGDATVLFVYGKGRNSKDEFIVIPAAVEKTIRRYLAARKAADHDPLFVSTSNNNRRERMTTRSISQIAKDSMVNAGYDSSRLTAHSLRHTAGTLALLNGATVREVQAALRHKSVNTTNIYLHDLDNAQNTSSNKVAAAVFQF